MGFRVGVVVKLVIFVEGFYQVFDEFDQIFVMMVEFGFGGQGFMLEMMFKLCVFVEEVKWWGLQVWLQVDGGIFDCMIGMVVEVGVDMFVVGLVIYGVDDVEVVVFWFRDFVRVVSLEL